MKGRMLFAAVALLVFSAGALADMLTPQVPFAFTSTQKHSVLSASSVTVGAGKLLKTNAVGMANKVKGGFKLLSRTSRAAGTTLGDSLNVDGEPVMTFTADYKKTTTPSSSNNPDFASLIPRKGDPSKADMIVHFEAPSPASVYHIEVDVTPSGDLVPRNFTAVDFSAQGGVWVPCAGSESPWGTHIGGEEYEPDARIFYSSDVPNSRVRDYARFYNLYLGDFATPAAFMTEVRKVFNPYHYGHIFEVEVDASGKATANKLYALGRAAWEMALVMPDEKTVYLTDDGRDVGFYRFVATVAGDLSKGRLYAAKYDQQSSTNGGTFAVSWVDMGAVDAEVLEEEAKTTTFADIFDYAAPVAGQPCPQGFVGTTTSTGAECLRLKAGMEMHAAGLETRRYASYLGATTDWNKWEGITYDAKRNKLYTAMSYLEAGTLEEPTRFGGKDHVRLPPNKCGCIYALDLDANLAATSMSGLHCGDPVNGIVPGKWENNTCHIDKVANIDNIYYDSYADLIFINEDSDTHENNFMWTMTPDTLELTRILSAPIGAETTGIYAHSTPLPDGGHRLVYTVSMQHPYGSASSGPLATSADSTGIGGWIGYIGPIDFPASSDDKETVLQFQHIPAPITSADKQTVLATPKVVVGMRVAQSYKPLLRSGTKYGDRVFGEMYDQDLKPITDDDGKPMINDNPDFTAVIGVCDRMWMVTGFEAPVPNPFDISRIKQNPKTGEINKALSSAPVDWGAWGGVIYSCAGSVSPWNTRIGSEEADPDARLFENVKALNESNIASWLPLSKQFGLSGKIQSMLVEQFKDAVRPYRYGFVTEVKVNYDGSHVATKHYTLGRISSEMGYVMPDRRTVYIEADDSNQAPWLKFVADRPNDLSSGSLYASKFRQLSAADGGKFSVSWVHLGWACQEDLMPLVDTLQFSDIFNATMPISTTDASGVTTVSCPAGYTPTNAGLGCECLMLRPGMAQAAAFLETRRYAAYAGATTEWSKLEGLTFDPKRNKLYVAISVARNGVEDNKSRGAVNNRYDACGSNDVRIEYNPCGCVYQLDVDGKYDAYSMETLVCGVNLRTPASPGYVPSNGCWMDSIAEPDNIAYVPTHDVLLIGEDTSEHQNDAMWIYDFQTRALTRIMSAPYGSETTSTYWYRDLAGFDYAVATVQHPYGESDQDKINDPEAFGPAAVGFILGPIPHMGSKPSKVEDCSETTWSVGVSFKYSAGKFDLYTERYDEYIQAKLEATLMHVAEASTAKAVVSGTKRSGREGSETVEVRANVNFRFKADAQAFIGRKGDVKGLIYDSLAALRRSAIAAYGPSAVSGAKPLSFDVDAQPSRVRKSKAYSRPTGTN